MLRTYSREDALSAKPSSALYSVFHVDDLGNLARSILSSDNIDLFAPLLDENELEGLRMAAAIVSKMPVKTTALLAGTDESLTPFLQVALSLPAELKSQLDLVESGKAKPEDIVLNIRIARNIFYTKMLRTRQKNPSSHILLDRQ